MKRINGKPMCYWQQQAENLVIDTLVRAAISYGWKPDGQDKLQSIIHKIAADRLMEIAKFEDPELVDEILKERDTCLNNFSKIF